MASQLSTACRVLAFGAVGAIVVANPAQAGNFTGASLAWAFECFNDSIVQKFDESYASSTWYYTNDAIGDDYGGDHYEIFGSAFLETDSKAIFVINTRDMPLHAGAGYATGWGDLLIDMSGRGLAANNGNLFGVNFGTNNSGVGSFGLYGSVTAGSVAEEHGGFSTVQASIDYAIQRGVDLSIAYGDVSHSEAVGFYGAPGTEPYNIIQSGTFLSEIAMLDMTALLGLGYNGSAFNGGQTIAFSIDKSSLGVVASAPAPVVNAPAPVVNAPAPVVNAPAPVVNAPAPVVNAPAPVESASTPEPGMALALMGIMSAALLRRRQA